jgi:16S rRNA (cytosine967-C5)-methyltransferase
LSAAPAPAGRASRDAAVAIVSAVLDEGRTLDSALDPASGIAAYRSLPDRDRRLAHAIAATALRRHGETEAILRRLIDKPPGRRAGPLARIVEVAAVQILYMGVADHAAVSTAVDQVADDHKARHFKGLANAVLRRLARERDTILAGVDGALFSTPHWLGARWAAAYGEGAACRIAAIHLVEPALDLTAKDDPAVWAERLGGTVLPSGSIRLVPSGPIDGLPGFAEGAWWVQDAAAALPARLLGDVRGLRIADLCAAPGGKTAQLAAAGAKVTSVDQSKDRLKRVDANLKRLRLEADIVVSDVLKWSPGERFDAVLLDAPCTATGTIRRHPDIAWLKKPEDVAALARVQAAMIDRAADLVRPGGTLVFCTCSLEPEEGEHHLERLRSSPDWSISPVSADEIGGLAEAITPAGAVRTLPFHLDNADPRLCGLDGFFMMRLKRR